MKTSDQNLSEALSILLMGPPGGGKTTLMMQFPGLYILNCDRNLAGPVRYLKSIGKFKPFKYDTISQYEDDEGEHHKGDMIDIKFGWDRLRALARAAIKDPSIQTIGLDTLTWCDQALYAHSCRVQGLKELEGFNWSPYKRELHAFLSECKASGKTVIVNCHEKIEYDKKGAIEAYVPSISTGISAYFGYYFSDIWRCTLVDQGGTRGLKAIVTTHPTAVSQLKNSILCGNTLEASYEAVEKFLKK
jgi:GTPase SAR1 family protein